MTSRIAIHIAANGDITAIASDTELQVYVVSEAGAPTDRVYPGEGLYDVGPQHVRALLGDEPVGHRFDTRRIGTGHGPPRPPSRPDLKALLASAPLDGVDLTRDVDFGRETDE